MAQTTALPSHAPLVSQLARAKSCTEMEFSIPQIFLFSAHLNLSKPISTYPNISQNIPIYPYLSQAILSNPNLFEPIPTYPDLS